MRDILSLRRNVLKNTLQIKTPPAANAYNPIKSRYHNTLVKIFFFIDIEVLLTKVIMTHRYWKSVGMYQFENIWWYYYNKRFIISIYR